MVDMIYSKIDIRKENYGLHDESRVSKRCTQIGSKLSLKFSKTIDILFVLIDIFEKSVGARSHLHNLLSSLMRLGKRLIDKPQPDFPIYDLCLAS